MKVIKLIGGGLVALAFAFACGGKSTQAGGSNTNWFETCASSAQCGAGLECWCGICTTACATGCASGNAAATCSEPPASCSDPSMKSACALQCSRDADCKDLGVTATCVDSVCHKGSTRATSDGGTQTCDQRGNEAGMKLAQLEATADTACTTTADCVAAPPVSCTNACDKGVISKAGLAAIQSSLSQLESGVCAPFAAAGCTVVQPPCVSPGVPACVAGKCQNTLPTGASSCDSRANQLNDQIFPMLDALDKSCKADDDCTREQPDLNCDFGCPVPVSRTAAAAFDAKRASLQTSLCDPYLADGCMPLLTGCPAVPGAAPKCVSGVCKDVFTTTSSPDAGIDAGPTCATQTAALNGELSPVVATADQTCAVDGDCKVVMLVNQCIESCTYAPASVAGAATIQGKLDDIDAKECGDFASAGCTVTRLPCVAPPTPTCKAGKCAVP